MKLKELERACQRFSEIEPLPGPYEKLMDATDGCVDLERKEHRAALLNWLRHWGCRQFALASEELSSTELLAWHRVWESRLPPRERTLQELSAQELWTCALAYDDLRQRKAAWIEGKSGSYYYPYGPTGAAKTLFAVRPQAMMAWDEPIRKALGMGIKTQDYARLLEITCEELQELEADCTAHGVRLDELSARFNRPCSTPVKMVDEYFWVRYTRGLWFMRMLSKP